MNLKTDHSLQKREKTYLLLLLLLVLFFYIVFIYRTSFSIGDQKYFTLVDDAMISMRYAKHFSQGHGFVWNVGGSPVQGFTNLGWTLYMSLLHLLPIPNSKVSLLVMLTSVFLLLGLIILSFKICKQIVPNSEMAPLIAATVTAFYYPLVFWSLRGMEVGVVTFLVYLLALLTIKQTKPIDLRRAFLIGLFILLAIVVRIDVILQVTLILVYILYKQVIACKKKLFALSPIILFYVLGMFGTLLFQYLHFGSVYPNTYYLKVAGVSIAQRLFVGIQVFVEYAMHDFLAPLLLIIAGILVFREFRKKEYYFLLALFIVQCFYSVYVGGDYAEDLVGGANRFITQGMISIIIIFSVVIDKSIHSLDRPLRFKSHQSSHFSAVIVILGISLATLLVISGEPWLKWSVRNAPLLRSDIWKAKLGIHIKKNTDKDAVIAAHAAGQIPYYSDRQTVDLLGKSDPVVAKGSPSTSFRPGHNKWNYEYSIVSLRPDLVADEWGQVNEFLTEKSIWERLPNGIWIRRDSDSINIGGLSKEYK